MPANTAVRDYLMNRRSVGPAFLGDPGPDPEQLEQMLTIATRVPDHGKLTPWRLIVFEGEARGLAGERLASLVLKRDPGTEQVAIEQERRQFLPAPVTVGVISSPRPHPRIPEFEQLMSASNVAFNLVHGAFALGFAAQWVTRWFSYDAEASAVLGARPDERFVGFVHIGTPTTAIEDRPRPPLGEIVSHWQG